MRKKAESIEIKEEKKSRPDLDCCVCIHKRECSQAEENSFCSRFKSEALDPGKKDPNTIYEEWQQKKYKELKKK